MSVYKRKGTSTYTYDFRYRDRRFCGDTREASKRAALAFEDTKKAEAILQVDAEIANESAISVPRTWDVAASRYWHEVGQHHKNHKTTFACLAWLTEAIGPGTLLQAIDTNKIALLVAKRRGQLRMVGRPENRKRTVSPSTVNRTMLEPLRKVLLRARDIWEVPIANIKWSMLMLDEPQERVREASIEEESQIMGELSRGYEIAVRFAFLNGCRRMEIVGLKKTDVYFTAQQFKVLGKGNRSRIIPMSDETYQLLWSIKDHPSEFVFTYEAARTDSRKGLVKGMRYPITDAGLRTAMRRKTSLAGVVDFRFHDTRHTFATRVLRTSNLKVVKDLLGHSSIETTDKYAHAMTEDLRAALNAASPVKSPVGTNLDDAKALKGLRK